MENNQFNEIWNDIHSLNEKDPASHSDRVSKTLEELGELAKEVNKTTGRKRLKGETPEQILVNIRDEGADVIQNVISLLDGYGITPNELLQAIVKKNIVWGEVIKEKQ